MKGYFFNAQATTDIVAHPSGFDREYDADDFNRYMGLFFTSGVFVRDDPDACKVTAVGLNLTVKPGVALVDGGQCHFEAGDTLSLSQGSGMYSVMCRRNSASGIRAFELIAIKGTGSFPAPVREGDIYDLCLAHVTATASSATVADTRGDGSICGFAALTGQPPYYPPDDENLPYILWLYTLGYPMTAQQKAAVEGNPSLMAIFNQTRVTLATQAEAKAGTNDKKLMTPALVKQAIKNIRRKDLIGSKTTAGNFSITIPAGVTKILYAIIGGGGGGAAALGAWSSPSGPGASGFVKVGFLAVTQGQVLSGIVGAGGAAGSRPNSNIETRADGEDGGATSFNGIVAKGGGKGYYPSSGYPYSQGGQSVKLSGSYQDFPFCLGYDVYDSSLFVPCGSPIEFLVMLSLFTPDELPFVGAVAKFPGSNAESTTQYTLPNGKLSPASTYGTSGSDVTYSAKKSTDPGAGGGACRCTNTSPYNVTVNGSAGCDGGIFIYDVTGW